MDAARLLAVSAIGRTVAVMTDTDPSTAPFADTDGSSSVPVLESFWFQACIRIEAIDFEAAFAEVHEAVGQIGSKCYLEPVED